MRQSPLWFGKAAHLVTWWSEPGGAVQSPQLLTATCSFQTYSAISNTCVKGLGGSDDSFVDNYDKNKQRTVTATRRSDITGYTLSQQIESVDRRREDLACRRGRHRADTPGNSDRIERA